MENKPKITSDGFQMLDTPWMRKHVENHIIVGLIAKQQPVWWPIALFITFLAINSLLHFEEDRSYVCYIINLPTIVVAVYLIVFSIYSNFYFAAILWFSGKGAFGIVSLAFFFMCLIHLLSGDVFGWIGIPLLLLFFPCLEFLPNMVKYQKVLSILRLLFFLIIVVIVKF